MKIVYEQDILERLDFAKKAGEAFANNPELTTYTDGPIEPGCYFAVRWGLSRDCALIFKLDENLEPEIYGQIVPPQPPKELSEPEEWPV